MTRRCINRDGLPALIGRDYCDACEEARKAKNRKLERRRTRRRYVSLPGPLYARLSAEADRRGQSIRSLLAEVLNTTSSTKERAE